MCEHSISNLWRAVEDLQIENQRLQARVTKLETLIRRTVTLRDLLQAVYGIDEGRAILDSCDSEGCA